MTHSVQEAVFLATRVIVMSARPGRVVLDQRVELPCDADNAVRPVAVTGTPEFQRLRLRLSEAVYAAHG